MLHLRHIFAFFSLYYATSAPDFSDILGVVSLLQCYITLFSLVDILSLLVKNGAVFHGAVFENRDGRWCSLTPCGDDSQWHIKLSQDESLRESERERGCVFE